MSLLRRGKDSGSGSGHLTSGDVGRSQFGTPLDESLYSRHYWPGSYREFKDNFTAGIGWLQ
jgi:hypothetical protein